MKKYFVVKKHEEGGWLGGVEKEAPAGFEPLGGMGVAHDCLEHFAGDEGTIDDEFEALGCALWIRGVAGHFSSSKYSAEYNVASDMPKLYSLWHSGEVMMRPAKSTRLHMDDIVVETAYQTRKALRAEHGVDVDYAALNRFCEAASYWLQIGFNKGKKKYPNNGKACCIFMDIEKKVDGFLKYAEEGDEIHIRFKKTELSAQVNHISYYELLPEDYAY